MMRSYNPDVQPPASRSLLPGQQEPGMRKGASGIPGNVDRDYMPQSSVPQSSVPQSSTQPSSWKTQVYHAESTRHPQGWQEGKGELQPTTPITAERSTPSDMEAPDLEETNGRTNSNAIRLDDPSLDEDSADSGHGHGNGNGADGTTPDRDGDPVDSESFSGSIATEPERGLLPVLKNRNFLTLWSGQVFSQLADKVYLVLMIALIASRFQTAGQTISGWVSSLMIAFTIPAVLFGSVAGVFVDHWRKRAVLVSTNLLRGGLVLALPILLWLTQDFQPFAGLPIGFLVVLSITFFVSTLTQFFAPAEQAVIPLIVERKHLLSANSLYTMTMMASVIVGFALGEPLLALADRLLQPIATSLNFGPDLGKELLVGGSYTIAGLLLMLLKTKEKTVDADESLPDVWQNIRDGLRYLNAQSRVRAAMIHLVILFSIFAALAVLAVRLAEIMPEIKSSQFGFLLAAGGVGMAIGAVLVGQFGQRFSRAQLGLYGSIGMAASLASISVVAHHLLPTLPLLVILGACAAIVGVPMQTAIQEETPAAMRGKVFGLQNNAINIALSLPLALAGIAETIFGIQAVFLGLALLAIAGGVLTWSISRTQPTEKTP